MVDIKFKIILINHSFQINYFSRRWKLFAKQHPNVDVTLLAPQKYHWYSDKSYSYGKSNFIEAKEYEDDNFHIRLFNMKNHKYLGWTSPDFINLFLEINPDIIYHIGIHNQLSLVQVINIAKRHLPKTKVIAFSMRGPALNLKIKKNKCSVLKKIVRHLFFFYQKKQLNYINRHCKAFFCHYPRAVDCFRQEGYLGPIYMQTQVGVNVEWFYPNANARKEIRDKYNLGDSYVFGSATRFALSKGVDDIIESLPLNGNWKYLMMGTGNEDEILRLKNLIIDRGLEDKIIMPGFIDWYDMPKYWNAIDCALHTPKTTDTWEETFSLSVVQAMATGKPIIGNTSGSIPYQIGFSEMITAEGDVQALRDKIVWILNNVDEGRRIGELMQQRARNCFSVQHLNDMFYDTILDVLQDKFDIEKRDMTQYSSLL